VSRLSLTLGAYSARSIIASAQRCVNLILESNPKDAPVPYTAYPAPGLRTLSAAPVPAQARCLYRANTGDLFYVCGASVHYIDQTWGFHLLGTLTTTAGICSMADNGTTIVLVDGSPNGYQIDLTTRVMTPISAATNAPPPASLGVYEFNGGTRVDALDGFIVTNDIGKRSFRSTYLNQIIWDSLWFADKNGFSDNLVACVVQKREIWLIGERTTEIWFNAGLQDFPFAIMPGPFIQHGCNAPYSIACHNGVIYWLTQDQSGENILARGDGYKANAVSTPALVTEWSKYPRTDDAIGFCFQQNDHPYYQINFPTADKTWRYDETTQQWHEAVWTDLDGNEHRHRANCAAFAYGVNVVGDWETGTLYALDPNVFTDAGMPMVWRRGFPHLVNDGNRVSYPGFALDVQAGAADYYTSPTFDLPLRAADGTSLGLIGTPGDDGSGQLLDAGALVPRGQPLVYLRWSDDRGATWSNPIPQSLGGTGQTLSQPQWSRTGMARDRIYEAAGVIPGFFAINGAFLDPEPIKLKS
jgi:hypothetical protein